MIPVVVGTNPERGDWLKGCLDSIRATTRRRRVFIHRTGGYEIAALRAGVTRFGRFLFLQDSVTILRSGFWDVIDSTQGSAWLTGGPPMYLGIHDSIQLGPALSVYPDHLEKRDAINGESDLPTRVQGYGVIWPEVHDATHLRMEERHGRLNMVLGNHLFEKHKGSWGQ